MIYADRNNLTSGVANALDRHFHTAYCIFMPVRNPKQKTKRAHLMDLPRFILYPGDEELVRWLRIGATKECRTLTAQIRVMLRKAMEMETADDAGNAKCQ